jgi:hypothetical protein
MIMAEKSPAKFGKLRPHRPEASTIAVLAGAELWDDGRHGSQQLQGLKI